MARRGGFQGGMPGNMNNLMKQAQKMQRQMEVTQKEMEEKDELTFIRKRNRSVQVFDVWKRKHEKGCEKLAQ